MDLNSIFTIGAPYASLIAITIVVILLSRKSGSFRVGKDGFELFTEQKRKLPKCASCVSSRDVLRVFIESMEKGEEIQRIKHRIMSDQMKTIESATIDVQELDLRAFSAALGKKIDCEVVLHPDFKGYNVLLQLIGCSSINILRNWCRENHFATQTREEEERYITQKTNQTIIRIAEMLDLYWHGTVLERADIYKINKEIEPQLRLIIVDAFKIAFEIARQGAEEILQLEEEYRQLVEDTISGGVL
jgi:regulator of RNase E activity RraB